MIWRIIGIVSLAWGGIIFCILSFTPLPATENIPVNPQVEFTIYVLSSGWLVASSLVKVGLILNKRWTKVSIISCLCFIFLLINMGLIQAGIQGKTSPSEDGSSYLYMLVVSWFVGWFWVDTFSLFISFIEWMRKKRVLS